MKNVIAIMLSLLMVSTLALASAQNEADKKKEAAGKPASEQPIILTKDNTITLNNAFYGDTVANLAKEAKELDSRTESTDPIYLVLNSPGGSIDAGLELIEILSSLKRPVKTISIFSASMGFQTVQGLGERLVVRDGTLMSHKARGGFYGEFPGQLDSRYSYYLKRVNRMNEQAVARTNGKHTMKSYADLIENEFWCDGKDCVAEGFADRVVTAQCDKSLSGTKTVSEAKFIYMGHVIEFTSDYDLCPVNTNYLAWHILIDGEPLFKDNTKKDDKKAQDTTAGSSGPSMWSSYFGGYGSSYSSSSEEKKPALTAEQLFEIQQKAKKQQEDKQNRQVIKGY
jgi:ATP-dependent protease ClpP protease subunit